VAVLVGLGVLVGVRVAVIVGDGVGDGVGVGVAVAVAVAVNVAVGVGVAVPISATVCDRLRRAIATAPTISAHTTAAANRRKVSIRVPSPCGNRGLPRCRLSITRHSPA
jgi:hypothetical protein